ncbi:hypothetical protein KEM55_004411 [Ascosphaera atra]|nr:hypothetical protein KEM55_004411 [Ascosphaera atra]
MDLKEKGMTWGQIKDEIEKLTGTQTNAKSLSKRYSRLKSNFGAGEFDESDVPIVLQCKQEIESKFQTELYARIAEMMKAKGRKEYTPAVIRKKVNELTKGKEVLDVMLDSCTS